MANILSQDEVDSLLKGLTEGEVAAETDTPVNSNDVIRYDFASKDRLIGARFPAFDMINGRFCVSFAASLAALVRTMVNVSVDSVGMVTFQKFHQSLPLHPSLHIFRMEPLKGHSVVVLESRLAFNLIECYFGGKASEEVKVDGREYTAIENRMIQNVIRVCLEDFAQAWKPIHEVSMTYVRSETNPQFAGIALPTDLVAITSFNVELDGMAGLMNMCTPYSTIEPIREKLRSGFPGDELNVDEGWKKHLREGIRGIMVEVVAELGTARITGHELLRLKVGNVIQLEQGVNEHLVAKVEGVPMLKVRPGARSGNNAIKVKQWFIRS